MKRVRVLVSGRVQGVWFRDACRHQARAAGVGGGARNLVDGRVEVVLEGPPEAVDRVVEWCRRGPPRADVAGVAVTEETPVGERAFHVR